MKVKHKLIIAGNIREAQTYVIHYGMYSSECTLINSPELLRGQDPSKVELVYVGNYRLSEVWNSEEHQHLEYLIKHCEDIEKERLNHYRLSRPDRDIFIQGG